MAGEGLDPRRTPFVGRTREAIGLLNEYSKAARLPFGINVPCGCLFSKLLTWRAQSCFIERQLPAAHAGGQWLSPQILTRSDFIMTT